MVENVCQQVRMMLIIVIFVLVENKTVVLKSHSYHGYWCRSAVLSL